MSRCFVSALCCLCLLGLAVAAPVAHAIETARGFLEYSHIEAPTDEPHGSTHDDRHCQVCVTLAASILPAAGPVLPVSPVAQAIPASPEAPLSSHAFFFPLGARAPPTHS